MAAERRETRKLAPRRIRAFWLIVIVASAALVVVPAEILLTIQHRRMLAWRSEQARSFDPFLQAVPPRGAPDLPINSLGFRGEEIDPVKPEDTYRIFVLGGSTVYSGRVAWEDSHPRILERRLRAAYPDRSIEVQNAGMHWHTTEHSLIKFLFKIQDMNPDLIIVYHGFNDLYRSFSPPQFAVGPYRSDYSHFYGPVAEMVREHFRSRPEPRLHIVRKLKEVSGDIRSWLAGDPAEFEVQEWPSLVAFERNLGELANLVLARDIHMLLASQPYLYRADLSPEEREAIWLSRGFFVDERGRASVPSLIRGMDEANRISREIAERYGVGFVDLEAAVPKTLEYFVDDAHYTPEGSALIGRQFADAIIRARWIDRPRNGEPGPDAP